MSLRKSNDSGHIELISVALIVYPNTQHLAKELIANIKDQDYGYVEVIVINNTSNLTLAADLDIEATRMVSIYDTEEDLPVGTCLNLAMYNSSGPYFIYWDDKKPQDHLSQLKQALDDYHADVAFPADQSGTVSLRNCLILKHKDLYYSPIDFPFREFIDRAKASRKLLYLPMKYKKTS
jgi:glycosyltransferase involved in cell wall biosynthesis